jgi:hypothetical protein
VAAPAPVEAAPVERPNPYAAAPEAPATASAAPAAGAAVPPAAPATVAYSSLPTGPSSTLSVLGLVFGILGLVLSFFAFGLLPAIAGVILGHLALKREPHARGMAIAGLVTGYVGIAISVLWGILFLGLALLPFLFIGTMGGFGPGDFGPMGGFDL